MSREQLYTHDCRNGHHDAQCGMTPCDCRCHRPAAPVVQGAGEVRDVLLRHHPIAHSETGMLKGCRCGQVGLGQDVIAHVADHVRRALDGDGA